MSDEGVVVPAGPDGRRSTSALGRAVVGDALRPVDPAGALAAEQETNWRAGYLVHFRRLVEAGLTSGDAARSIAAAGLASLHGRMRVALDDGEVPLHEWAKPSRSLDTVEVQGTGEREEEFSLPYGGTRLRGDDLRRRLDTWTDRGVLEPSAAEAVRTVMAHPEWLPLPDRTVVVLGAGAEMGRCRRCCAGALGWPASTCRGRRCGSGSWRPRSATPARCSCRASRRAPTWCRRCRPSPSG
jgi:hypothetical protein